MLITIPRNVAQVLSIVAKRAKSSIHYTRFILYGSYANGTYNNQSDLDIALFIKEDKMSILEAYRRVLKLCAGYDIDIQPQIFYESEYQNPMGIVEEIIQYGIDITDFEL